MLKFASLTSHIELPFYTSLAARKIDYDKLDDAARSLLGLYEVRSGGPPEASCRLQIHGNALTSDTVPPGFYRAEGSIKNVNTIEDYKNFDRSLALNEAATEIWNAIINGSIFLNPSLLASFFIICFADLKKYKFTYLAAFPSFRTELPWTFLDATGSVSSPGKDRPEDSYLIRLKGEEAPLLFDAVQEWRKTVDSRQHGFFLAKKTADRSKSPSSYVVTSLSDFEKGFFDDVPHGDQFICFADPSTYSAYPGWMLRNLLILVRERWRVNKVNILCYRDGPERPINGQSIILPIALNETESELSTNKHFPSTSSSIPKITGWERNSAGKVVNRTANLGDHMDPRRLADQAVDLNLKLIKWRIAPTLNLDKIKRSKCLLLGAGTLGSYVARNLMGWGVAKITFVDDGTVSYSNPVRQPLYTFENCVGGGTRKALRAAEALKEIYPGVNSSGHAISVPMAGHAIHDEAEVRKDFETLERLIDEHDVICLLMDSRESRWLPTVIGKARDKIVMNSALGFDTYVVMRHGVLNKEQPDRELGCYFCNDVVAPGDSLKDQTLDQQCTVTRPGLAAIASALLVEILVSLLQNPLGSGAPAPTRASEDRGDNPLGIVPHQIRGYLSSFENHVIRGKSYDCCSACSEKVVDAYKSGGWEFVKRALNEKGFVEELSGLAEVQRAAERAMANMELSEEDGIEDDGEGELI